MDISSAFDRASVEAVSKAHSPAYVHYIDDLRKQVAAKGGGGITYQPFNGRGRTEVGSKVGKSVCVFVRVCGWMDVYIYIAPVVEVGSGLSFLYMHTYICIDAYMCVSNLHYYHT